MQTNQQQSFSNCLKYSVVCNTTTIIVQTWERLPALDVVGNKNKRKKKKTKKIGGKVVNGIPLACMHAIHPYDTDVCIHSCLHECS